MPSFFDLSIAVSALRANQHAMTVTAHNVANANTEGYKRQEAVFQASDPSMGNFAIAGVGVPLLGTGVQIQTVRRMQTDFVDSQIRMMNQQYGSWTARNDSLQQIEPALSEPGDQGISAAMDRFWNAWNELSTSPESLPARTWVAESGVALADRIRTLNGTLRNVQAETDQLVTSKADEINELAHQIANLNTEIVRSTTGGFQPNDLLDRRDMLIENLSKIIRVEVNGAGGADMMISIGGKNLVQGDLVTDIEIVDGPNGWSQLQWTDEAKPVAVNGGEIKGLMYSRDTMIEDYITQLDDFTKAFVNRVNALHLTGKDMSGNQAVEFFVAGSGAGNIQVNPALEDNPSLVAASGTGAPGDNATADAISAIREETFAAFDNETLQTIYSRLIAKIGADTREANSQVNTANISLKQLKMQRESTAGVSLDEEMANMTRFQQGYNAAARVFSVVNDMMDTIINRMVS